MKKVILILILLLSTLQPMNALAASASHEQLSEYSGYTEALYESVLREKAYLAGQYTNNKQYIEQTVDEFISSGKAFFNEMISVESPTDILEKIYAGGVTAGEWVKRFFDNFNQKKQTETDNTIIDYKQSFGKYIYYDFSSRGLKQQTGYSVIFAGVDKNNQYREYSLYTGRLFNTGMYGKYEACGNAVGYAIGFTGGEKVYCSTSEGYFESYTRDKEALERDLANAATGDDILNVYMHHINKLGLGTFIISENATGSNIQPDIPSGKNLFNDVNNFIKDENIPSRVKPLSAQLVCPDGQRISINHNGTTFIDKNGQVMQVNTDGTSIVDSSICNLEWQKPNVYYDENERLVIEQDGVTTEIETGEEIGFDDQLEDGCGIICAVGKMLTGLGQIAKSITGLVGKILDGLLALFVPDNLDFVSEEFDKMSAKFTDKFSLLTGLKDTITGVFQNSDSGNPLSDVNMSLPAAPGFNFNLDTITFIEPFVPRVKQIISGILFLMTIIYVYRKITGRGGVMEK